MNRPGGAMRFQTPKITPVVKKLMILNVGVWFIGQLILDKFLLPSPVLTSYFGLRPILFVEQYMIWQPLTYMFLHAASPFHILFNMISLWFFGVELESRWGSREFLMYYLVSGVGAAFIYLGGVIAYTLLASTTPAVFHIPVIGASGAIFGIFVAYAVLFGEREIYFWGIFPIKAKFLVMILAGIEVFTLMSQGMASNPVANLCHIGGMISGFLYLVFWTKSRQKKWRGGKKSKARRNLRLVVNNKDEDPDDPKYWN